MRVGVVCAALLVATVTAAADGPRESATPASNPKSKAPGPGDAERLFRMRDYPAAADAFRALLKVDPNSVVLRYKLAATLTAAARWADALTEWTEVLRRDPKNEAARLYAERVAEKATKAREDAALPPAVAVKKAEEALAAGVSALALRLADSGVAALPPAATDGGIKTRALLVRARALTALGQVEQAISVLRRILAATPREARAHFALGDAYRAAADTQKAAASYERFLAVADADDATLKAEITFARRFLKPR